jgi:spermidine/putrescine transport system substrate-binding protein
MKLNALLAASVAVFTLTIPARAADPELLVLDWAGFEVEGLLQAYKDKYGDTPTYSFFGSDDEAFQKVASGFKST